MTSIGQTRRTVAGAASSPATIDRTGRQREGAAFTFLA
jgi:hypothetical protein